VGDEDHGIGSQDIGFGRRDIFLSHAEECFRSFGCLDIGQAAKPD
jgi:hypothetical protein